MIEYDLFGSPHKTKRALLMLKVVRVGIADLNSIRRDRDAVKEFEDKLNKRLRVTVQLDAYAPGDMLGATGEMVQRFIEEPLTTLQSHDDLKRRWPKSGRKNGATGRED